MEAHAVPREALGGTPWRPSAKVLRLAPDARLVTLVRRGDAAAFEAVYDRYHRQILSFCRHMLGDPDEAADAVQHTFLDAYTAIVASDKTLLLRAWLFTIARNRCCSMLRSRREQPVGELAETATEGLAVQVQRREDLRALLADMRNLPDEQRAALVLAELDTLSHQEIGEVLGIPSTKIKALVFQARESLIASRAARDTSCEEIRRQLATMRGGALRRGNLRRHLRQCDGCREFRAQLELQRRGLAAILPVAPALALREAVLGATGAGGAASGMTAGGGLLASSALKGLATKGAVSGLLALLGTAGAIVAAHALHHWPSIGLSRSRLEHVVARPSSDRRSRPAAGLTPAVLRPGERAALAGSLAARWRDSGSHTLAGRLLSYPHRPPLGSKRASWWAAAAAPRRAGPDSHAGAGERPSGLRWDQHARASDHGQGGGEPQEARSGTEPQRGQSGSTGQGPPQGPGQPGYRQARGGQAPSSRGSKDQPSARLG